MVQEIAQTHGTFCSVVSSCPTHTRSFTWSRYRLRGRARYTPSEIKIKFILDESPTNDTRITFFVILCGAELSGYGICGLCYISVISRHTHQQAQQFEKIRTKIE